MKTILEVAATGLAALMGPMDIGMLVGELSSPDWRVVRSSPDTQMNIVVLRRRQPARLTDAARRLARA